METEVASKGDHNDLLEIWDRASTHSSLADFLAVHARGIKLDGLVIDLLVFKRLAEIDLMSRVVLVLVDLSSFLQHVLSILLRVLSAVLAGRQLIEHLLDLFLLALFADLLELGLDELVLFLFSLGDRLLGVLRSVAHHLELLDCARVLLDGQVRVWLREERVLDVRVAGWIVHDESERQDVLLSGDVLLQLEQELVDLVGSLWVVELGHTGLLCGPAAASAGPP